MNARREPRPRRDARAVIGPSSAGHRWRGKSTPKFRWTVFGPGTIATRPARLPAHWAQGFRPYGLALDPRRGVGNHGSRRIEAAPACFSVACAAHPPRRRRMAPPDPFVKSSASAEEISRQTDHDRPAEEGECDPNEDRNPERQPIRRLASERDRLTGVFAGELPLRPRKLAVLQARLRLQLSGPDGTHVGLPSRYAD